MIYLIIDVHYQSNTAVVAGIRFQGIATNQVLSEHRLHVDEIAPYESGQFYKREMPCILALLEQINVPYDIIIIDGYVYLDSKQKAGLGKHLHDNLETKKPIIGIAKNKFHTIGEENAVYRGKSKQPLYVTCVAMDVAEAQNLVKNLAGKHRLPHIVKKVDELSRL